jgi:hypothetical protein
MHAPISAFSPAVVLVLSIGASACEDSSAALQAGFSAPSPFQSRLVSVEPGTLHPEFLASPHCRTLPPFRTRFNLFLHADRALALRALRFDFLDHAGRRALPIAIPGFFTAPNGTRAMPITIPSSPAIPVPGTLPFHGALSPGVHTLGLQLNFDCGVPAKGTLFINVESENGDGVAVSRVSVRVAG